MRARTFVIIFLTIASNLFVQAQELQPKKIFEEQTKTHNAHICFDGKYYYTAHGGIADEGVVNKIDKKGHIIESFALGLDMRSLLYDNSKKCFYVCTFNRNIYQINNLKKGNLILLHEQLYEDENTSLGISRNGKYFYCNSSGFVFVYEVQSGELVSSISNIQCGREANTGAVSIAVGNKCFYTLDSEQKTIFKYNLQGSEMGRYKYTDGDFSYSLSFANNYVFIAKDGNYNTGCWYGYKLK